MYSFCTWMNFAKPCWWGPKARTCCKASWEIKFKCMQHFPKLQTGRLIIRSITVSNQHTLEGFRTSLHSWNQQLATYPVLLCLWSSGSPTLCANIILVAQCAWWHYQHLLKLYSWDNCTFGKLISGSKIQPYRPLALFWLVIQLSPIRTGLSPSLQCISWRGKNTGYLSILPVLWLRTGLWHIAIGNVVRTLVKGREREAKNISPPDYSTFMLRMHAEVHVVLFAYIKVCHTKCMGLCRTCVI